MQKEVDDFIKDINLEYQTIKKEIKDFFQKINYFDFLVPPQK